MTRTPMTQAVAADYADAMLVGRRAKNVLFLLLALVLLIQLAMFFVARYVPSMKFRTEVTTTNVQAGTGTETHGSTVNVVERQPTASGPSRLSAPLFEYLSALTDYLGVLLSIVLAVVLLLVITIMLVGRLVGVAHVTGAFCWSVVFIVMLFPWQSLLNGQYQRLMSTSPSASSSASPAAVSDAPDVRIPGVLYTYPELRRDYDFPNIPVQYAILKWARFVAFPDVARFFLLMIHGRSGRGLRFALGEADVPVDVVAPGNLANPSY